MLNHFGKYLFGISLCGLIGLKFTQNQLEKQKINKYGCFGKPKKYSSYTPSKKEEIAAGVIGET